jgi:hypothetical protein
MGQLTSEPQPFSTLQKHIKLENKTMIVKFNQQAKRNASARMLFAAALVLASAVGAVTGAVAQTIAVPPTPIDITPPAGNTPFLVGHAQGSQGYICLPTSDGGTSWAVNPARPEATLFTDILGQNFQIITHFASINANPKPGVTVPLGGNATWQSSLDTSKVWATATGHIDAGTDPNSCPNSGSIQCLLLQSVGNQKGPTGGRLLNNVTFIQRLNTSGGSAPTTACTVGQTQLEGYTADYYFYRASN